MSFPCALDNALPAPASDVAGIIPGDPPLTVISPLGSGGTHVLVLEADSKTFGLLVDEVTGLIRLADVGVCQAPRGQARPFISGTIDDDGQLVLIADAQALAGRLMSGATVLIADDSLVIRAVVRAGLEGEGYSVREAVDGTTALEECRQQPPDVVLLDIEMPGLDGYQVLAALKADPDLKDVPVVFLTSRASMQDVVAGLRGGAHDYLKKPFEPPELLARVASAAHVKHLQDTLRRRNAELDRMSRTDVLTGLYNRRHLDEELLRRIKDALRYHNPICLLLLDIDHFKRVNDTYGHPAGDLVLSTFAQRLSETLRAGDIPGRWGGEEFLVILPRTDLDGALVVAERVRSATAAAPVEPARPVPLPPQP